MIKARIRWCSCRVENILTLGKLLRLWFCFLLHSIFLSQTSYRTYKIISSYELARPMMGTIFLVYIYIHGQTRLHYPARLHTRVYSGYTWHLMTIVQYFIYLSQCDVIIAYPNPRIGGRGDILHSAGILTLLIFTLSHTKKQSL